MPHPFRRQSWSSLCRIEGIRLNGRHIIGKNRYGKNGKKHTDGQNERENFFHNDYLHNIAIPRRVTRHAHLSFIFFCVTERNPIAVGRVCGAERTGSDPPSQRGCGGMPPFTAFIIAYSTFDVKPESDEEISRSCDSACFGTFSFILCKKKEITRRLE